LGLFGHPLAIIGSTCGGSHCVAPKFTHSASAASLPSAPQGLPNSISPCRQRRLSTAIPLATATSHSTASPSQRAERTAAWFCIVRQPAVRALPQSGRDPSTCPPV